MKLAAASNTEIPAYYQILELGFTVTKRTNHSEEIWYAENSNSEFSATGLLELLGLINLAEAKGKDWRVTDEQIDEFLSRF